MGLCNELKIWAGLIVKEVLDFKVGFGPGLGTDWTVLKGVCL